MFLTIERHPGVVVPWTKEPHYFDQHFDRGVLWYRAHFGLRPPFTLRHGLTVDATPTLLAHPQAHQRVYELCPDARLLVLVRNPAERAHSHWALHRSLGWDERDFAETIASALSGDDTFGYLSPGRYIDHLDRWLTLFEPSQLLVMSLDELITDQTASVRRVFRFAGLDDTLPVNYPEVNSRGRDAIDPSLRSALEEYYAPSLVRLHDRYGLELVS